MTAAYQMPPQTPARVAVTQSPEGLHAIHDPTCAAAVWTRAPLDSFQSWLDAIPPDSLPRARSILRPNAVPQAVKELCDLAGLPDCDHRTRLIGDIAALAHIFAEVSGAPYLRLRLDVITTNACRKFHIDAVKTRLVCTYRGTGTQYGNALPGHDPQTILTVDTGCPILLRGTLSPVDANPGLLHRSPPIEGTGESRLVLVLDPIEKFEVEPGPHPIH